MYYRSRRGNVKSRCVHKEVHSIPNVGYYTNSKIESINSNNVIPIMEILNLGDSIITLSSSSVSLNNGVYEISFSAISTSTDVGISNITLFADETATNISSSCQAINKESICSLSAQGVYVSKSSGVQLRLINCSSSAQQFSNLNLVIKKLS